ncbi:MAG: hypothetical protein GDA44_08235, partial [Prochloron sp. SP5CPC1]|nr:hypothetical protein [Candidatus Paraprochloron terpiosi SP5CPC1]
MEKTKLHNGHLPQKDPCFFWRREEDSEWGFGQDCQGVGVGNWEMSPN